MNNKTQRLEELHAVFNIFYEFGTFKQIVNISSKMYQNFIQMFQRCFQQFRKFFWSGIQDIDEQVD